MIAPKSICISVMLCHLWRLMYEVRSNHARVSLRRLHLPNSAPTFDVGGHAYKEPAALCLMSSSRGHHGVEEVEIARHSVIGVCSGPKLLC